MMNNLLGLAERSSVATIVGTFFFLVVMIGGFAALVAAFELNSDLLESQFKISQQETQKVQEDFTIAAAYNSIKSGDFNTLCVTIKNEGAVPLEIPDLFIVNATDPNASVTLVEVSYKDSFVPVGSQKNILETQAITHPDETDTLKIKAVTTSGIAKTTELTVFGQSASGADPRLNSTLMILPPNIASGQNVTLILTLFNAANTTLLNAQPTGVPTVTPPTAVPDGFHLIGSTPSPIPRLDPNESTFFAWAFEITGGVGSTIDFTVNGEAEVEGCSAPNDVIDSEDETVTLEVVPGVRREIFAKPEILVSFPSPFGDGGNSDAFFAVVVFNPTANDMTVTQVGFAIATPDNKDTIQSAPTGVTPSTTWTDTINTFNWEGITSGNTQKITPLDAKEFIVEINPKARVDLSPVNPIFFNVYSDYGQFGRGGFALGIPTSANTAIPNIYQNTTDTGAGIKTYYRSAITTGDNDHEFFVTLSNDGGAALNNNAFMLLNIPSGFTDIKNGAGFACPGGSQCAILEPQTFLDFDDGSTQLPIKLPLGLAAGAQLSYTFTTDVPAVSKTAFYTFTYAVNGTEAGQTLQIGSFSESGVQVCPLLGAGPALDCGN